MFKYNKRTVYTSCTTYFNLKYICHFLEKLKLKFYNITYATVITKWHIKEIKLLGHLIHWTTYKISMQILSVKEKQDTVSNQGQGSSIYPSASLKTTLLHSL